MVTSHHIWLFCWLIFQSEVIDDQSVEKQKVLAKDLPEKTEKSWRIPFLYSSSPENTCLTTLCKMSLFCHRQSFVTNVIAFTSQVDIIFLTQTLVLEAYFFLLRH